MTVIYGRKGEDGKKFAYDLLRDAVKLAWDWTELPDIERSERGKPHFSKRPGYWFSLSHSGGYALCALSDDGPVGVDIESVRPRRDSLKTRILSPAELEGFDGGWEHFYRIWTLKESWCKREDIPLYPPRNIETPPLCPHGNYEGGDWVGAVCCSDEPPRHIIWL